MTYIRHSSCRSEEHYWDHLFRTAHSNAAVGCDASARLHLSPDLLAAPEDPALIDLLAVAAILMFIVTMMGIAPVVTYWLMVAFLASIVAATLKTESERLIQRVRTA